MMDGHRDDASYWANFSPSAHAAELQRMRQLFQDPSRAQALIEFGLRPFGRLDLDPYAQPPGLNGPWEPQPEDLTDEPVLVDLQTGWRFRVEEGILQLDLGLSDNFLDAQLLLSRAAQRGSGFAFETFRRPARHHLGVAGPFPIVAPLQLHAADEPSLQAQVDRLRELFCGHFHARRLWFRGQREERRLPRSEEITRQLYGIDFQPWLHPSLGRHAARHPDQMGFGFAFAGPHHAWKKPFLIWLMRANRHWFTHEPRCLEVLDDVLGDDADDRFARLLLQIQMSPVEVGDAPFLNWPDEADDLRQWFFAFMKRQEFAVTLQQYGYTTSLLDLTQDLQVALYFTQASMVDKRIRKHAPRPGRVIYVFAQTRTSEFFRHGEELFWGDEGWERTLPPRLARQHAGFIGGSTNRTQNFYAAMVVATIHLGESQPQTQLDDQTLFPSLNEDLLYATLAQARPAPEGLY